MIWSLSPEQRNPGWSASFAKEKKKKKTTAVQTIFPFLQIGGKLTEKDGFAVHTVLDAHGVHGDACGPEIEPARLRAWEVQWHVDKDVARARRVTCTAEALSASGREEGKMLNSVTVRLEHVGRSMSAHGWQVTGWDKRTTYYWQSPSVKDTHTSCFLLTHKSAGVIGIGECAQRVLEDDGSFNPFLLCRWLMKASLRTVQEVPAWGRASWTNSVWRWWASIGVHLHNSHRKARLVAAVHSQRSAHNDWRRCGDCDAGLIDING